MTDAQVIVQETLASAPVRPVIKLSDAEVQRRLAAIAKQATARTGQYL